MRPTEQQFETDIQNALVKAGYDVRSHTDYDRPLCLDPGPLFDFLIATQPKEWERLKQHHGAETKRNFMTRLARQIERRGTLDVFRNKVKDSGCTFELYFPRPSSTLNQDRQRLYETNQYTVIRQLRFNEDREQSLDLVLFLNGIPIFTAELKTPLTGQNVDHAKTQYQRDRDPKEPLFQFGRCLAHFAVDPESIAFTTELAGTNTRFFPFNKGYRQGAGNPPVMSGYATAYLWEEIWRPDTILQLIQNFVHPVEEEDSQGKKQRRLIFPRYHQLEAVSRLVTGSRQHGTGQRYLIQHSAGSGKTYTISWLAHQLSVLHDERDERIFDSIIVVSDRKVIDKQLQEAVMQFEQTLGVVENIDTTSRQLREALEGGKTIIVTTLQKFPVIAAQIQQLSGQRFAVIIDEAHSSQSGETSKSLRQALMTKDLDEAERQDREDPEDDLEDRIVETMRARGHLPNVSTFAFTATPKPKTMELFGEEQEDGSYLPFSLYSMRQAIEEGFILDVLRNYTTFRSYFNLLKSVEDDPEFPRRKAVSLLKSYADLHDHAINTKVEIMLEHFTNQVMHLIQGRAKAMIVTRSRLHAVKFRQAVDSWLEEHGNPTEALVAFTGTVNDGYADYTEARMNGFPEAQTRKQFDTDDYRILIVASKFQTGFDQPLLHTMYVDKKLGGVQAVQTLSRLNRTYPGKTGTMVLDFANAAEEIELAFQPYYQQTLLREGTDHNKLYDLELDLRDFHLYSDDDVERFARAFFTGIEQSDLSVTLRPIVDRYEELEEEKQVEFRGKLNDYVRLYAFLSQLISFRDTDLEKLYQFSRYLFRQLPIRKDELPIEVLQDVDMESYRVQQTGSGDIQLSRRITEVGPTYSDGSRQQREDELEPLSQIIQDLNDRFGFTAAETEKLIRDMSETLAEDRALQETVKVNTASDARRAFDSVVDDRMQERVETNWKFYQEYTDNQEFREYVLGWLFGQYSMWA